MKNILLAILFFTLNLYSQNTIKGKLHTSDSFKKEFPIINVSVDGFSEKTTIDTNGLFELNIEKPQTQYLLNFFIGDSLVKTYTYINDWTNRAKPKSISFTEKCSITVKSASKDWKNNDIKLYIYQDDKLLEEDIKFQQKYNFTYVLVNKKDYATYDCYKNYNKRALKYLVLEKELSIKHLNKNTIGKSKFSLNDKPCIQ